MPASDGSNSSITMDEKTATEHPTQQPTSKRSKDSLERISSRNSAMDTSSPKDASKAEADLERGNLDEPKKEQDGPQPAGPPAGGPPPGMAPADFPDGGVKAWLTLFGGFCGTSYVFCSQVVWTHGLTYRI